MKPGLRGGIARNAAGHLAAAVGTTVTVTLEQGVRGGITTSVAATAGVSPTSS